MPNHGDIDTTKPLPAKVEEAARIEALEGLSLTAIAERVGLTRQTLSNYRNHHPLYLETRMELAREMTEPLQTLKSLAQVESLKLFRKAVEVVDNLLDYEVDGVPQTGTQLEAARLSAVLTKTVMADMAGTEEKAGAVAAAAVVIRIEKGSDEPEIVIEHGEIVSG